MAPRPDTTTGTITLTNGLTAFTTVGTQMITRGHLPGDTIRRNGLVLTIATITGENTGTLEDPCPAGAAGSGVPVRIRWQADGSRVAAQTRNLVDVLGNGNLEAEAGLTGAPNMLSYFTGIATKALTALTAAGRALIGVTGVANTIPYFTSATAVSTTALTAAARALLDDADAEAMRATLVANGNIFLKTLIGASTTFTPNPLSKYALIEIMGGGGQGGQAGAAAGAGVASAAGGGGEGGYVSLFVSLASIASLAVSIGAGGTGTGGTTTVVGTGVSLSAGGGTAGANAVESGVAAVSDGGSGGAATGGQVNVVGTDGDYGLSFGATINALMNMASGRGGGGKWGSGGKQTLLRTNTSGGANGQAGSNYGAGGSGGVRCGFNATNPGGNGAPGRCIITEFR